MNVNIQRLRDELKHVEQSDHSLSESTVLAQAWWDEAQNLQLGTYKI
jgi:hypothetical protein